MNRRNLDESDVRCLYRVGKYFADTYADEESYQLEEDLIHTALWFESIINECPDTEDVSDGEGTSLFGGLPDQINDDVLAARLKKLINKLDGIEEKPKQVVTFELDDLEEYDE